MAINQSGPDNQKGSILVQALIIVSTSVIVIGAAITLLMTSSKERSQIEKSLAVDMAVHSIRTALMRQNECGDMFHGMQYQGKDLKIPKMSVGKKELQPGKMLNRGIKIQALEFQSISSNPTALGNGIWQYKANLSMSLQGDSWISKKQSTIIPLRLNVDASTKKIVSCADERFFNNYDDKNNVCSKPNYKYVGLKNVLGANYQVYYMIYIKATGLTFYCIVPQGSNRGYLAGCFKGRCLWN